MDSKSLGLPEFLDSRHMKVVRLSAQRTYRLFSSGDTPGTHFCYRLSRSPPRTVVRPEEFCLNQLRRRVQPISHAVHRNHQSVLCFQNFTSLRGTRVNVRSLTTIPKVRPFQRLHKETHLHSAAFRDYMKASYNGFHPAWTAIQSVSSVKCVFHCADFHEPCNHSITFCGHLMCLILSKCLKLSNI